MRLSFKYSWHALFVINPFEHLLKILICLLLNMLQSLFNQFGYFNSSDSENRSIL